VRPSLSLLLLALAASPAVGLDPLADLERLAAADPKPFVLVEASHEGTVNRAQGVVISPRGHVLSAGHVAFISEQKGFSDQFRISLRGRGGAVPGGAAHLHKTLFADREGVAFFEHYYPARLLRANGSRFLAQADLALFKMKPSGDLPTVEFFAQERPQIALGETLYLCHYNFPHRPADPTFLINPIRVVGVAQTSFGPQYLGEGYYRIGSSGGALLKDGRLIGLQSAAYTVNAKDGTEIPLGLISFQPVWAKMVEALLEEGADESAPPP
jgi:hypothetical protein